MSLIYITGHRNPDLDSVCSAYAYSVLKNQIDKDNKYIPVRCGHLSKSTRSILERIDFDIPVYKKDINPKVKDVLLVSDEKIDADMPLNVLAASYKESNPSVVPIFDDKKFLGLLSIDDITLWLMNELSVKGNIDKVPIIRDIMREADPAVDAEEFFEDAKVRLLQSGKRGLAVFDDKGFAGYVTRRCFLRAPRHNVILVDHNEPGQSIRGIETANIVEIIDHHRLNALKTDLPIYIDSEPLGSTCTIVYQQFVRHNVVPDCITAKILLTGIIGDTLILKSPTTTAVDCASAKALAKICDLNLEEYGIDMFSHMEGLKTREPETAINSDFKVYEEKGIKIGIGQCEVTTLRDVDEYSEIYINALESVRGKSNLDWAVLMITDVLREHSILLTTNHKANRNLQYRSIGELIYDMPGVMSRKKQLLPEVLHAVSV